MVPPSSNMEEDKPQPKPQEGEIDFSQVQLIDVVRVGANNKAFITKDVLEALEAEDEDSRIGFWRLPNGQIVARKIDYVF